MVKNIFLSMVIPVFNEEGNIFPMYESLMQVLPKLKKSYEIIFVDDGSSDRTCENLIRLNKKDKNVRVIQFRKNFGQTAAMDAGFKNARGEIVVSMDGDLQNDPADIPRLLHKIREGYDVVSGWRYNRRDTFSKKIFSRFANKIRRRITGERIHDSGCSLKAYKRETVVDLELYGEMHRYIPALLSWKGYRIGEIKVRHHKRHRGVTKYGAIRLVKGFTDLILIKFWMSFSSRPIHLFGGWGLVSFAVGFIIGLYLVLVKYLLGQGIGGRPLLLFSVLLMVLGIQLIVFGILADIMIRIYYSKQNVKTYSIRRIL